VVTTAALARTDLRQEQVQFGKGHRNATVKRSVKGRQTVDGCPADDWTDERPF
jgi:hypothetical protein